MNYNLSTLGPREFEHLTQALTKCVMGPGVGVFGDGKDGGREAAFRGRVNYPFSEVSWDGYGVVQAKFRQSSNSGIPDATWLKRNIKKELDDWSDPRSQRGELPEYLLFTTNVVLSPAPARGGIDQIDQYIAEETKRRKINLKGWAVWHYDEICRYLDMYPTIRQTYAAFITPGDVLSRLLELLPEVSSDTFEMIRMHASMELLADQWVRLGQAGANADAGRISLGPIAVDLKADLGTETVQTAAYVIDRGNSILRPSQQIDAGPHHILIIGGPGQGKSTLGQLICQAYRVALLDQEGDQLLTGQAREVLNSLRENLANLDLPTPRFRRWPLRIALHDYANAILGGEDLSLLRFLTNQVKKRGVNVSSPILQRWLRIWPWIIILDGLDEVASVHTRDLVMSRVSDFLLQARSLNADLLIVGTTRPQGYNGEFHQQDYQPIRLVEMSMDDALHYANKLALARHQDDPDLREQVTRRIIAASEEEATARLMRSPLQVTIMSLLVEKRARMPQNRYELFHAYYDTIYAREVDKPNATGQLLADQRQHVDWLHQYVGVLLQIRAARAGSQDSIMPKNELEQRLQQRLLEEIDAPEQASLLSSRLIDAATDRLVLLVAPELGHIGFEVRSLQEYCAARALISGPDTEIIPRLEQLALHPTWANTWLLAAAGIFTNLPHLRADLINVLRSVDAQNETTLLLKPGAQIALLLLDEDLARQHPKHQNLLVQHAAELITQPIFAARKTANVLLMASTRHPQASNHLQHAAKRVAASRGITLMHGSRILTHWARTAGPVGLLSRQLLDVIVRQMTPQERAAGRLFSSSHDTHPLPGLQPYIPTETHFANPLQVFPSDPEIWAIAVSDEESVNELSPLVHFKVSLEEIDEQLIPCVTSQNWSVVHRNADHEFGPRLTAAMLTAIEQQGAAGWQLAIIIAHILDSVMRGESTAPILTIRDLI